MGRKLGGGGGLHCARNSKGIEEMQKSSKEK